LTDAEHKRRTLEETLRQMAIWNVHNPQIIEDVIGSVTLEGEEKPPKKAPTMSVENYVRIQASKQ